MANMISFDEAQKIVWDTALAHKVGIESVPVSAIDGRICAETIEAPLSIQPFDNSAMDGFAVRLSDLERVAEDRPVTLRKTAVIAAGDAPPEVAIKSGECAHIMTGAPVPPGAEAVVPVELVKQNGEYITFRAQPKSSTNIRRAGEDFKKGDQLLKAGDHLSTAHILSLATLGISEVKVFQKPRAAFLATGKELVDDLSISLKPGQVYNSNRPYGVAALEAMGADCIASRTLQDEAEHFSKTLDELKALDLDIIVSSGAVSAGEFDFVKEGLKQAGAEILYHKTRLKPGKPNLLALLPNGTLYFGLPGNPVASAVGLRFFVDAAIRAMMGQEPEKPIYAKAMNKFSKKSGLHMILKGRSESWEDGSLTIDLLDGQASFMVSPFLKMDCWVHIPEDVEMIKAGDVVDIYPLF
ncbi:MAG: molybdopterin molybdotransferase MoeA [Alcanivorax sp.]